MTARPALLAATGLLALTACGRRDDDNVATDTASISFNTADDAGNGTGSNDQSVALSVPGFSAKLSVPGLSLGAHDTQIDGIAFHPGSRITGMNVNGQADGGSHGGGRGTVEMHFVDPAAPPTLLDYYRGAAKSAGWSEVTPAAGEQFAATHHKQDGEERLGLSITPGAAGSTGRFVVTGG